MYLFVSSLKIRNIPKLSISLDERDENYSQDKEARSGLIVSFLFY
jgi:hypothetical protein